MSKQDKSFLNQKIDRKWVRESGRTFSKYPGIPRTGVLGEEEMWLELLQFYRDDLKWLLSLDHHKFWSHMIYSKGAYELLVSFLRGTPPNCVKKNFIFREDLLNMFRETEHLVFLAFLRLSMEKESASCFVRNFREVIYDNYLFTVPIILDICLIYGTSNHKLVKEMISSIVTAAPDFLDDFQEVIPHFVHVLKTVEKKLSNFQSKSVSEKNMDPMLNEVQDLLLYLSDAVATVEVFIKLYPNICQLFSRVECITEIAHFYSNILPGILNYWSKKYHLLDVNSFMCNLLENVRFDLLKIVKSVLDFVLNESKEVPKKKEDALNEYLALVTKLSKEPDFLCDYNQMYSIEIEVECIIKNSSQNENLVLVNHVLKEVASVVSGANRSAGGNFTFEESEVSGVKFNSLVTEVKDIFPHLEENFIEQCLNYYDNSTEKVIAAVLENLIPPELNQNRKEICEFEKVLEFKGKHKNKHKSLNELLNDRQEISKMKERYAGLSFVLDETYDDEYDDTYDENVDVSLKDEEDTGRRPFVVPRVLRTGYETDGETAEEQEDENVVEKNEDNIGVDHFIENPAVVRERTKQLRSDRRRRDVTGAGRGQGQSKEVLKNREFKESHKSQFGNHNRKKQAGRKLARGLIPS